MSTQITFKYPIPIEEIVKSGDFVIKGDTIYLMDEQATLEFLTEGDYVVGLFCDEFPTEIIEFLLGIQDNNYCRDVNENDCDLTNYFQIIHHRFQKYLAENHLKGSHAVEHFSLMMDDNFHDMFIE